MNRLALVLAAASLGTGCIVVDDNEPCTGTVSLQWSFQKADGSEPGGSISDICFGAGVAFVDVFMNDAPVGSFNCTDAGVTVTGVRSGAYLFTVEGIDASGAIRYRDEFNLDASRCANPLIHTRPSQGIVSIDYSFSPTNACYSPGPTYMSLQVRDEIARDVAFFEPPTTGPACDVAGAAPAYILPTGSFTLQWIQEMVSFGNGAFGVVRRDCTDYPFTVPAAASTTVFPVLTSDVNACP